MIKVVQKNEDLFAADGELSQEKFIYVLRNLHNIILFGSDNRKTYIIETNNLSRISLVKALTSIFHRKMFLSFNAKETCKWILQHFDIAPIDWNCCYINAQILKKGVNVSEKPEFVWNIERTLNYSECEDEVLKLVEISERQNKKLSDESMWRIATIEAGAIPAFAQMELYGAPVDVNRLGELHRELFAKVQWEADSVQAELPGEPINLESPKELLEKLKEMKIKIKKPDGKSYAIPDTSKDSLGQMVGHTELRDGIIAYRTAMDTFEKVNSIRKFVKNKKVHATFNQIGAGTGRTSTQDPNLAGIPESLRFLFAAPKGQKIITGDYSQCELKIIAHISQDKTMLKAFKDNVDIHSATASAVFGRSDDDLRKKAKAINFGLAYGQGEDGLAVKLACSIEEARDIMKTHEAKFPSVYTCLRKYGDQAVKTKMAKSLLGRIRLLDDKTSEGALRRAGANMVIQGTAADMIKMALWHLVKNGYQQKMPFYTWNTVYDEISVLSFDKHRDVSSIMLASMNHAMSEIIPSVPPGVDISINDNWD